MNKDGGIFTRNLTAFLGVTEDDGFVNGNYYRVLSKASSIGANSAQIFINRGNK